MDFIKKNPVLTISLVIAIVLAVFLGLQTKSAMASAEEAGKELDELRAFGRRERAAKYSASNENLEIAEKNYERAETELETLRMALHQRSRVEYNGTVSNTKCKNHLIEGTRTLERQLTQVEGIAVQPSAEGLSFASVISSDKLPDETIEVPVLMKQFEIVREVIRLLAVCDVDVLHSLKREAGIGIADKEDFEIMPFSIRVEGRFSSIKEFMSKLQHGGKYFFALRTVSFSSGDARTRDAGLLEAEETPRGRRRPRVPAVPPRMPMVPDWPGMEPIEGTGEQGEEEPEPEDREVLFPEMVIANIRFDFVEFKNPLEEK